MLSMGLSTDGMRHAPTGAHAPVVPTGSFRFAAMHLDHGHIYGMCKGLIEAGADLAAVFEPDPVQAAAFTKSFPQAKVVSSAEAILDDPTIKLVAAAAVPCDRGPLGIRVMRSGKDYFTDKTPFTSLDQLAAARHVVAETGRKYAVYYSERLHVESAVHADHLVAQGAIGRVIQVLGLGPHRLGKPEHRPRWFYERARYGGILCDIGSHQVEQFLHYTGNTSASIASARVGNFRYPQFPELEDFGDFTVTGANGATGYHRVDWLTPDGLGTWGDGRTMILGTEGYIELRKYIDVAGARTGNHVIIVDQQGEQRFAVDGMVGYPYFGQLILDCLERSERAMTQAHTFLAAELCLRAQAMAVTLTTAPALPAIPSRA